MKVSSRGGFTLVRIFQNATSYILTYSVYIYEHRFIHIYNFLMIIHQPVGLSVWASACQVLKMRKCSKCGHI